jgi:hypothetical protein
MPLLLLETLLFSMRLLLEVDIIMKLNEEGVRLIPGRVLPKTVLFIILQ